MTVLRILALLGAMVLSGCVQIPERINVNLNRNDDAGQCDQRTNPSQQP